MVTGGCHCGAIRYSVDGDPVHSSICHCSDCRRCAGAPMVGWAAFGNDRFAITRGEPVRYASSPDAIRSFCGTCGTGIAYVNEAVLPGLVDIQTCTLDDPERFPPQVHVQAAERLEWTRSPDAIPAFERYPA